MAEPRAASSVGSAPTGEGEEEPSSWTTPKKYSKRLGIVNSYRPLATELARMPVDYLALLGDEDDIGRQTTVAPLIAAAYNRRGVST